MISIFSKFKIAGGSERRCVELANGLLKMGISVNILCREKKFPESLLYILDAGISVITDCLNRPSFFYDSEFILVVNSDSRDFTKLEYWDSFLDTPKLNGKTMCWLFNFIVSPSISLSEFEKIGVNVGIITTNNKFFNEISNQERYMNVRHFPRLKLESPIRPFEFNEKPSTDKFVVSMLSKPNSDKWNLDIVNLIDKINTLNLNVEFKIMGISQELAKSINSSDKDMSGVLIYQENEIDSQIFLFYSDLFLFYPSYKRQEPWARVIGEAMACGLPIVALDADGGTREQVINGNNGFLCLDFNDILDKLVYLITNKQLCKKMGRNSRIYSNCFRTEVICNKLIEFLSQVNK